MTFSFFFTSENYFRNSFVNLPFTEKKLSDLFNSNLTKTVPSQQIISAAREKEE